MVQKQLRIKLTDMNPSKWSNIQKHTDPVHQLALEFIDGKLENWEEYLPETDDFMQSASFKTGNRHVVVRLHNSLPFA